MSGISRDLRGRGGAVPGILSSNRTNNYSTASLQCVWGTMPMQCLQDVGASLRCLFCPFGWPLFVRPLSDHPSPTLCRTLTELFGLYVEYAAFNTNGVTGLCPLATFASAVPILG